MLTLIMTVMGAKIVTKVVFWLATEITLSCMGLDDLADYSEFVFDNKFHGQSELCLTLDSQD